MALAPPLSLTLGSLLLGSLLLASCASLPPGTGGGNSWYSPAAGTLRGGVEIAEVRVDKQTGWLSIEEEIRDLAPLLFLEAGFGGPGSVPAGAPRYRADIQLREREHTLGWKTMRSLSVELRLRPLPEAGASPPAGKADEASLPLAAGRVIRSGNGSLSSSAVLSRMLDRAIGEALEALSRRAEEQEEKEGAGRKRKREKGGDQA
jgi:hypothetical protein